MPRMQLLLYAKQGKQSSARMRQVSIRTGARVIYSAYREAVDMRSLLNRLPGPMRALLEGALNEDTREIRLRVGRPLEIRGADGESRLLGPPQEKRALDEAVSALAGHSVYALEEHMREGYFSLPGGYRDVYKRQRPARARNRRIFSRCAPPGAGCALPAA